MTTINIITFIGAIGLFITVLELVRRRGLREEYSLLWLGASITYLVIALWPKTIGFIADLLGISDPFLASMFIGINFLLIILIQYSTRLSKLTNRYKDLAQQIAIIDHELSISSSDLRYLARINKAYFYVLAATVAAREKYTRADIERKVKLIRLIANMLNMSHQETESLEFAAILHDIGKIKIPVNALHKTSKLNEDDWEEIKKHPLTSVSILEGIPFLLASIPTIQYHHEHWDGTGYPEAIEGEAIPIGARILSVADTLVALTSDRPYRDAVSLDQGLEILSSQAGKQFDPCIVDLLKESWDEVKAALEDENTPVISPELIDLVPDHPDLFAQEAENPDKGLDDLKQKLEPFSE